MQTIRLRVNDEIYKNLLWFLSRFGKDEIQVINEKSEFLAVQEYLKNELDQLESGTLEFVSFEELDNHLEETLRKYDS